MIIYGKDTVFLGLLSSSKEKEYFQNILDILPVGVSIQTVERIVEYENQLMKSLVGSQIYRRCYHRWKHLPGRGQSKCIDCPFTVSLYDHQPHKIYREKVNTKNEPMCLEIQTFPIINNAGEIIKILEVITDRTLELNSIRSLSKTKHVYSEKESILNRIKLAIMSYGERGSEVMFADCINFFASTDPVEQKRELYKLATFTFIGILQNNPDRVGLFGPLPVLDYLQYSMLVFSFQIRDDFISDPRKHNLENNLLMIFFPRDFDLLHGHRKEITDFIKKEIQTNSSKEDFTKDWYTTFRGNFFQLIHSKI